MVFSGRINKATFHFAHNNTLHLKPMICNLLFWSKMLPRCMTIRVAKHQSVEYINRGRSSSTVLCNYNILYCPVPSPPYQPSSSSTTHPSLWLPSNTHIPSLQVPSLILNVVRKCLVQWEGHSAGPEGHLICHMWTWWEWTVWWGRGGGRGRSGGKNEAGVEEKGEAMMRKMGRE